MTQATPPSFVVYMVVVTDAKEAQSQRTGAPMIRLVLVPMPRGTVRRPGYFVTHLVNSARGDWTIDNFLVSAGIHVSPAGAELSITPACCLRQVVYPLADANRNHTVLSLLPRKEAIARNPALGRIPYPVNWPTPITLGLNIEVSYGPVS
jgi:hypothetical protein